MGAPVQVRRLIDEFGAAGAVKDARFKEDWTRSEFIEPLFRLLGWERVNPATITNKTVGFVREIAQDVGGATKAPDYGFLLDGNRVFYAEAKKPTVQIKSDKRAAYQLRRYGWNAGHPVGILTDFGEFAIYNCRLQPDVTDLASVGLLEYLTSTDYAERWDWLVEHLSPEGVREGSLQLLVAEAKKGRRLRPVDAAFLAEIESWRAELASTLMKNHPGLATHDLNYAVQSTIDRIVFLRIAEARGLEEEGALERVGHAPGGLYRRLLDFFQRADTRYNSGLFHFRREKGRGEPDNLTPSLKIDDSVLRSILIRLSRDKSPYEFSVISPDILGQAYEEFLGRTLTLDRRGRVRVEEKPEVRKAGGVYYTPRFVVSHIVRNTLRPLLARKSTAQVEKLRIVDPACGSGSFLIEAYQYLLDWHLERYQRGGARFRRHLSRDSQGRQRLSTEARKRILLNNIYGVDIDPQAVEVAKLSLLLKVIEGETQLAFAVGRLLPDLDRNICCGNSLVGSDFYASGQLIDLTPEEAREVNAFDWSDAFPGVFADGGFDAVIGNPPWLMAGYYVADSMPYFRRNYVTCTGKADLYYLFLEKASRLVRRGGRIGMIVPNKLFHTKAATALRTLLTSDDWVESIVDFGTEKIFGGATNYSCILLLKKASRGPIRVTRAKAHFRSETDFAVDRKTLDGTPWYLVDRAREALWEKVRACGEPLYEITTRFGTGVQSGADRILILSADRLDDEGLEDDLVRPILKGRDVRRYHVDGNRSFILFPYRETPDEFEPLTEKELKRAPIAYEYLRNHKKRLGERVWFGRSAQELSGAWYGMMYLEARASFEAPHLLTPSLSDRGNFALGTGDLFVTGTAGVTSVVLSDSIDEDPRYFVALLNSTLLGRYAIDHSPPYQGGFFKFSAPYLKDLPIRRLDFANPADRRRHDTLVGLSSQLSTLYASLGGLTGHDNVIAQRTITAAEAEVDDLVCDLYGLSAAERAIVEQFGDFDGERIDD